MNRRSAILALLALVASSTAALARAGRSVSEDCDYGGDDASCDGNSAKSQIPKPHAK